MDNFLRQWITSNITFGKDKKKSISVLDIAFVLAVGIAGFVMRFAMRGFASADYNIYIGPWMEKIQEVGGLTSIGMEIGNYPPLYMYFFAVLTYLPCSYLTSVKLLGVVFDYLLAIGCGKVVYQAAKSKNKALLTYGVVLLLPTVAVDSGLWAQVDSIYATFLIFSLLYIMQGKSVKSFVLYGLAFALKLQCLFLLPLYIVLWVKKKEMKLWHFLLIPVMYFTSVIPAWIAGRSLKDLLLIYFNHYGEYTSLLSYNRPNGYTLTVTDLLQEYIGGAGTWFTLGLLIILMAFLVMKNHQINEVHMIHAGLLMMMTVTFFLPYMHERYGYVADLLAVMYGIIYIRKFYITILCVMCSLGGYVGFITGTFPIPYTVLAVGYLYAMYVVARDLYEKLRQHEET